MFIDCLKQQVMIVLPLIVVALILILQALHGDQAMVLGNYEYISFKYIQYVNFNIINYYI